LYGAKRPDARAMKVAANPSAIIAVAAERQRLHSSTPAVERIAYGTTSTNVQISVSTSPPERLLTVKLSGRPEAPDKRRQRILSSGAGGA
jgi:hypothetical protein